MKKLIILFVVLAGFATVSNAQNSSANAAATATLITPLKIDKIDDMAFGTLAGGNDAGTAVLDINSAITSVTGSVKVITAGAKSAKFTIQGEASKVVAITYPLAAITLNGDNGGTLTLDNFTNNINATTSSLGTGGTFDVILGATLNVPAHAVAGLYTTATPLTVTVHYN